MDGWLIALLSALGSAVVAVLAKTIVDHIWQLPKKWRTERENERKEKEAMQKEIASLREAVDKLPGYRAQSIQIQEELKNTDCEIVALCKEIREDVLNNREEVMGRLRYLESREKNALRSKIIDEYRLFTNQERNPEQAWTEMEAHAFWALVRDYVDLGGNDFVHSVVIPAMNRLEVIPMSDIARLEQHFHTRRM